MIPSGRARADRSEGSFLFVLLCTIWAESRNWGGGRHIVQNFGADLYVGIGARGNGIYN